MGRGSRGSGGASRAPHLLGARLADRPRAGAEEQPPGFEASEPCPSGVSSPEEVSPGTVHWLGFKAAGLQPSGSRQAPETGP